MRMMEMNFDLNKSMNISKKKYLLKLNFNLGKSINESYINPYSFKLNLGIV